MTAAFDIDKDYPACEQPNEFAIRWQNKQLTDAEKASIGDVQSCSEAFAILYPDYVSLHEWREQKLEELAPKKDAE